MKRRPQPLVLVTGAACGIGKATSERLLHDGARVIALDRSTQALAKLATEKGRKAPLYVREFDLLQIGKCSRLIRSLVREYGPITRAREQCRNSAYGSHLEDNR